MNLLVIDSSVTRKSPSMRAWLAAAPIVLPRYFKRVDIWAIDNELELPIAYWHRFPKFTKYWPVYGAVYRAMIRRAFDKIPPLQRQDTLVQCTGALLEHCDVRYIQFWNRAFQDLAASKPKEIQQSLIGRLSGKWAARDESRALKKGATGEWWCVSRGIAEPIRLSSEDDPKIRILPNTYDAVHFNSEVRREWRTKMRQHYGFSNGEHVLAFSAFGHYERKGLLQAAEAIARLRAAGENICLLVLGGSPKHIHYFKKKVELLGISTEGLHFAGLVNEMEKHLSAADGLFFPSHFEAFSLVEIEAAALGLRLYLTAHPGSEMILREGINGRLLPWEVQGMVNILHQEIHSGAMGTNHSETGEALDAERYTETLGSYYENAIENFRNRRRP